MRKFEVEIRDGQRDTPVALAIEADSEPGARELAGIFGSITAIYEVPVFEGAYEHMLSLLPGGSVVSYGDGVDEEIFRIEDARPARTLTFVTFHGSTRLRPVMLTPQPLMGLRGVVEIGDETFPVVYNWDMRRWVEA